MANWFDAYIHANGVDIHYYRTGGDKPAVVLLHGITDNSLCWTRVASHLQDSYDVIMPDARGHGRTGGPLEGVSVSMLADDVAAFIQELDLEQPFLYGHSMGAITAMRVAAAYPDLVSAIVLEDPPLFDAPLPADEVTRRFQQAHAARALSREQLITLVRHDHPNWAEEELAPWAESKLAYNPTILHMSFVEPWREILGGIECPALLLTGDPALGALVTPDQATIAKQLLKNGILVHIVGAGHSIHRERFEESMTAIREFLSDSSKGHEQKSIEHEQGAQR